MITNDNSITLALVKSALCMFYLITGLLCFLYFNKSKLTSKYILSTLLFLLSIGLLKDIISQFFPWYTKTFIQNIYLLFDLTIIPLYSLLIFSLIYRNYLTFSRAIYHILPYFIWILIYGISESLILFYCALIYLIIYIFIVLLQIITGIQQFQKSTKNNNLYHKSLNINLLKIITLLFMVNLGLYLYSHLSETLFYYYYFYCLCMWLYTIHNMVLTQATMLVFENKNTNQRKEQDNIIKEIIRTDEVSSSWQRKLDLLLENKQIFLNHKLTMKDISVAIGTNRTYLSIYLNNTLNTDFYDYINNFRLNYAENLLKTTNEKIVFVAHYSGFNSFNTFLRSFKKKYGCTPTEYKDLLNSKTIKK